MKYTYENLDLITDYEINQIIKGVTEVSPDLRSLAEEIYKERDLASPQKQSVIAYFPELRLEIIQGLFEGSSHDEEVKYLVSNGVDREQAQFFIKNIDSQVQVQVKEEKAKSKGQAWLIIGVILAIIKLIISANK